MPARCPFLLSFVQHSSEIFFQRTYVFVQRIPALVGQAARCARFLSDYLFPHFDVSGLRQFVYLHAQIAGGGLCLVLEIAEVSLFNGKQERHHGKAQLGVQQWVKLSHIVIL